MTLVNRLRNTALDRDNFPRMDSERWLPVGLAVEATDEIDRLIRQLAEARAEREGVETQIRELYEIALRKGDDAAIGLSHALDIISPPREAEPSAGETP